jgi:hypothetical protein
MGGSSTFGSNAVAGIYHVLGKPGAGNFPGSRWSEATWTDTSGNLWLFGGQGDDATGSVAPGATTGNTSTITVTPTGGFTGSVALTAALTTSPSGALAPPSPNQQLQYCLAHE